MSQTELERGRRRGARRPGGARGPHRASSGEEISEDYEGRDLLLVGVLKGAVFFMADLMRH